MTRENSGKTTRAACRHLIEMLKSEDKQTRTLAWQGAGRIGAAAVQPAAELVTDKNIEISRAAQRALREICRASDTPRGVQHAKEAVVSELLLLLDKKKPEPLRRHVLWLLADTAGDAAVAPVAAILHEKALREDARMVLEHLPGQTSLNALKAALEKAPDDFKQNIVQSLRARGVTVSGHPCRKKVPVKETNVKPVAEKK